MEPALAWATEVMGGPAAHRACLEADISLAFDPSGSPAIDRACREERRTSPVLKLFLWVEAGREVKAVVEGCSFRL